MDSYILTIYLSVIQLYSASEMYKKFFISDYAQKCPDCHKSFYSATSLLVHFFSHVGEEKGHDTDNNENKLVLHQKLETDSNLICTPLNLTKDETLNPWKYCVTTCEENNVVSKKLFKNVKDKKKEKDKTFECSFCSKKFGWSTDLKRHLLIHTGTKIICFNNNIIILCKRIYIFKTMSIKDIGKTICSI